MITSPREEARGFTGSGATILSGFEEEYDRLVAEAQERASARGRGDVADYLTLRAANDRLRSGAVERLLETFTGLAGELNRSGAALQLSRTEAHRFRVGASTMVGTRLVLRRGVRSLTIEAGWPRSPRDGVVRGGGLASARLAHFGDRASDEELLLVASAGGEEPRWLVLDDKSGARTEMAEDRARRHVAKLLP